MYLFDNPVEDVAGVQGKERGLGVVTFKRMNVTLLLDLKDVLFYITANIKDVFLLRIYFIKIASFVRMYLFDVPLKDIAGHDLTMIGDWFWSLFN